MYPLASSDPAGRTPASPRFPEIEERILTKLGIGVAPEAEDDEAPALTAVPGDTAAG